MTSENKTFVTKRIKMFDGVTYSFGFARKQTGRWKVASVGKPSTKMPMDFAPFEVMDLVLGRGMPDFESQDAAEAHVRETQKISFGVN